MYNSYKNKGLYYRDKTRKRKSEILHKVKDSQKNACFFAKVKNPKTGKLYGEKHFFGYEILYGLIIENKLYYLSEKDSSVHFAYTNKRGFKILQIFDDVPDWASSKLVDKFNAFISKKD